LLSHNREVHAEKMYGTEKFLDACSRDFVRFGSFGRPGVLAVSEHYQRTRDPWVERRTDEGARACRWNPTRGTEKGWRTCPLELSPLFSGLLWRGLKKAFRIRPLGPWFIAMNTTDVVDRLERTLLIGIIFRRELRISRSKV